MQQKEEILIALPPKCMPQRCRCGGGGAVHFQGKYQTLMTDLKDPLVFPSLSGPSLNTHGGDPDRESEGKKSINTKFLYDGYKRPSSSSFQVLLPNSSRSVKDNLNAGRAG